MGAAAEHAEAAAAAPERELPAMRAGLGPAELAVGSAIAASPLAVLRLQRAIGNRATVRALQRDNTAPPAGATAPAAPKLLPRKDYVFVMEPPTTGSVFDLAEQYYKATQPGATIVDTKTSLGDIIDYLNASNTLAGNVYIVSHGAEDGTLFMGLATGDTTRSLTVDSLRQALSGTSLSSINTPAVDATTQIHIRGCDIGRTRPMLDLLKQVFGGSAVD